MKISTNIYNYKPSGNKIAVLSRELENNDSVELTAVQLGDRISKGHTFCLANFEGGRKVSNCINMGGYQFKINCAYSAHTTSTEKSPTLLI